MTALANENVQEDREFSMDDAAFKTISEAIYKQAGIVIDETKRELVYARVVRRLRALSLPGFESYAQLLQGANAVKESKDFINALTTNHTRFFREPHHFEFLQNTIIPYWKKRAKFTGNKRIRVWSSASSSGEEPYTLAMVLADAFDRGEGWDWKILATDIDTNILNKAKQGRYDDLGLEEIPPGYKARYLKQNDDKSFIVNSELKNHITFNRLNLHSAWPIKTEFDVIFCRNVFIYFDPPSKKSLVDRFAKTLSNDGWLFLGHSESILGDRSAFKLVGRTIYEPRHVERTI